MSCDAFTVNGSEEQNTWVEDGAPTLDLDLGSGSPTVIQLDQKVTMAKGFVLAKSNRQPVMFGFFKVTAREMRTQDIQWGESEGGEAHEEQE